jgi:arsenate reductase (thioredoxin)
MRQKILFLCTHNSARSQLAEGLVNGLLGRTYQAFSAGTDPSTVNEYAVKAMMEIGIDISHQYAKSSDQFLDKEFGYVITLCDHAMEVCPYFPGGRQVIHKGFDDPTAVEGNPSDKLAAFRKTRSAIQKWLLEKFGDGGSQ